MAFHTIAYSSSITAGSNVTINAVNDGVWPTVSNSILPPSDVKLLAAAGFSATMTRARVYSPKVTAYGHHCVRPITAASGVASPPQMGLYYNDPPVFRGLEQIFADVTTTANERSNIIMWFGDSIIPVPAGDVFTFRATATTTLTANSWTNCSITFDDNLPAYKFAVIGFTPISVNCQAARIFFPGQAWRPGSLGLTTVTNNEHLAFQTRQFGVYGYFQPPVLPTVDFLSGGTEANQEMYFQCVRVS